MGQLKNYDNTRLQRPDPPKGQGIPIQQRRINATNNTAYSSNSGNDSFIEGVIIGAVLEELTESDSDYE